MQVLQVIINVPVILLFKFQKVYRKLIPPSM